MTPKLSIVELRGVLQSLTQKLSYREIQKRHGVSKTTVGRIVSRSLDSGLNYSQLLALSDQECLDAIYPPAPKRFIEPDWFEVHKLLGRPKITLQRLFSDYERTTPPGVCYTYASFCRRYNEWKLENGIKASVSGNNEYAPGERMEIDFVGDDIEWVDSLGEINKARLFVASLPYSNLFFTEAFEDETQNSWISGIADALEYFGGVPQVLVMDNAKALVKRTDWREGEIQPAIKSLCCYYNMQPWACKPVTPKQKNRVEAAVGDIERWIIAEMSLKQLPLAFDLNDLNRQIRYCLDAINNQPFRGRGLIGSRRSRFLEEEFPHLASLPNEPYEHGDWRILVADKAHCIRINSDAGHRYSVPADYTHKQVSVRICRNKIEIYDPNTLVFLGVHERFTNARGNKTHILEEHLTASEKNYRRSKDEWIELFTRKGLEPALASEFVIALWSGSGNFSSGRVCNAVRGLFKDFAPHIITNAISAALEMRRLSYRQIKTLCERYEYTSRTHQDLWSSPKDDYQTTLHENIRNNYK